MHMISGGLGRTEGIAPRSPRSRWILGTPRAVMLALVFAALGLFSLRPFCELAFAGAYGDHSHGVSAAAQGIHQDDGAPDTHSKSCCAGIKDATLVKPAEPLISWRNGGTPGAAVLALARPSSFAQSRNPTAASFALPPGRSFYARSARILR